MAKKAKKCPHEKPGYHFLHVFYALSLVYGLVGIADALILTDNFTYIWSMFNAFYALAIFVLSIVAMSVFVKAKLPPITWVLPIYHLVFFIVLIVTSVFLLFLSYKRGILIDQVTLPKMLWIGMVSSVFEVIYSTYILFRYRK